VKDGGLRWRWYTYSGVCFFMRWEITRNKVDVNPWMERQS